MSGRDITSNGLDLSAPVALEAALRAQDICEHPAVAYRFPIDGSEPYFCTKCGRRFTWDDIESLNVAKGGTPGAFKS